jgi:hypothetical protein
MSWLKDLLREPPQRIILGEVPASVLGLCPISLARLVNRVPRVQRNVIQLAVSIELESGRVPLETFIGFAS